RCEVLLAAVGADRLAEVAPAVDEADTDEGDAQVGSRLQVVAGEDPQAPRVEGDRVVDAELGAQVGHRRLEVAAVAGVPGVLGAQVLVESPDRLPVPLLDVLPGLQLGPAVPFGAVEDVDRVAGRLPLVWVDRRPQGATGVVPRPPEV